MKFIPKQTKNARLWVEAVTKSLKIDKAEVAGMYANLCGYPTWPQLISAVNCTQPSQSDEECSSDIVQTRKAFYTDTLVSIFGMNLEFAEYLIDHASPSSSSKPKQFSISREDVYEPTDDSALNLREMGRAMGMGSEKEINAAMEEFARYALGDQVPDDFSFDNFAERMRISKPIEPSDWYNLLSTLRWKIDEDSFIEDYTYGEESFYVIDSKEIEIPVYITSLARTPLDNDDSMANEVLNVVSEHCELDCGSNRALLFWGAPMIKEINKKWFAHYGMFLKNGEWHEFLMNEHSTLESVFDQSHEDIDSPDPMFEDNHRILAIAFLKMLNGIEQDKPIKLLEVGTMSGWNQFLPEPC